MTNRDLLDAYACYNRAFFGNKLPKDMPVSFAKIKPLAHSTFHPQTWRPMYINISKKIRHSGRLVLCTLLHEMVHVAHPTKRGHGPWFEKAMVDLAKRHAFRGIW